MRERETPWLNLKQCVVLMFHKFALSFNMKICYGTTINKRKRVNTSNIGKGVYICIFTSSENLKTSIGPNEPTHKRYCCMPQID